MRHGKILPPLIKKLYALVIKLIIYKNNLTV